MKPKNSNSESGPNNRLALQMLAGTKENPSPRLVWDLETVMPSDLISKKEKQNA